MHNLGSSTLSLSAFLFAKRLNILQEVTFWLKMCGYIRVCVCVSSVNKRQTWWETARDSTCTVSGINEEQNEKWDKTNNLLLNAPLFTTPFGSPPNTHTD